MDTLNEHLEQVMDWMMVTKMKLNPPKAEVLLVGSNLSLGNGFMPTLASWFAIWAFSWNQVYCLVVRWILWPVERRHFQPNHPSEREDWRRTTMQTSRCWRKCFHSLESSLVHFSAGRNLQTPGDTAELFGRLFLPRRP